MNPRRVAIAVSTIPVLAFLVLAAAPTHQMTKALLYKPGSQPPPDQPVEYRAVDQSLLESLDAVLLADYQTYSLVAMPASRIEGGFEEAANDGFGLQPRPDFDEVAVNGYTFSSDSLPSLPDGLSLQDYSGPVGLYIAQMIGPNRPEWEAALREYGEPIAYLPENAFLLRADPARVQALRTREGFQHLSVYQPAYKVGADLLTSNEPAEVVIQVDGGQDLASVKAILESIAGSFVAYEPAGPVRNAVLTVTPNELMALAALPEVLWIEPLGAASPSDERQALAAAGQVYRLAPTPTPAAWRPVAPVPTSTPSTYQKWMESKGFCTSTKTTNCWSYYTKVAVWDSGLDLNTSPNYPSDCLGGGDTSVRHPDMGSREWKFFCALGPIPPTPSPTPTPACYNVAWPGTPPPNAYVYSDYFGHGTAVTGVITGDPAVGVKAIPTPNLAYDDSWYQLGTGVAPLAQVITARIWNSQGSALVDLSAASVERLQTVIYNTLEPPPPPPTPTQASGRTLRFTNHSWNDGATAYTTLSQKFDMLVRDSDGAFDTYDRGITLVVSAGNTTDPCVPNATPPASAPVTSPANAKNVIAVGATDTWRPTDFYDWGQNCGGYADLGSIACYSNRGVAPDAGRFKPDLVAVGTRIGSLFTRTGYASGGCIVPPGLNDPNGGYYIREVGTSFAAPVVTGAAILTDAWYYYHPQTSNSLPSPAMIKALLVAHASALEWGTDNMTGQTLGVRPSTPQGWGRVNLDGLFQSQVSVKFFDEDHTQQGPRRFTPGEGSWTTSITVDRTKEVILVLSFTDRFAAANASPLYVNNLNVKVWDGMYYYLGNFFSADGYNTRLGPGFPGDSNNTVEMIRIRPNELVNSQVTVEVIPVAINGQAVPGLDGTTYNQDFALYVYNAS